MEIEIGVTQPQAKECLEPSKAGRGNEGFFSKDFGGTYPANTLISDLSLP